MFRAYFPPGDQRMRLSAIIAIIGAIDTPIIYYASVLWQEAHPPLVVGPIAEEENLVADEIGLTLLVSVIAFTFLFFSLLVARLGLARMEHEYEVLKFQSSRLTVGASSRWCWFWEVRAWCRPNRLELRPVW